MESKIVIIGAGASGLAAGTKLLELGFQNVVILEAESRIGGRVNTVSFGSNVVDLGAQWCHGETDNVVYELAKKFNVFDSSSTVYEQFLCIKSNKEIVPQNISNRLMRIFRQFLEEAKDELCDSKESLGNYISKKYADALNQPENADIDRQLAVQFLEFYKKFENSIEASDTLFDVSGSGYLHYWECEGDGLLNWKDKGYVTLLNILMHNQPNKKENSPINSKILVGRTVYEIQWSRSRTNKTLIKCTNGEEIEADHVICTVSLGVLKEKHSRLFTPTLPENKLRAIEGLSIGTVNKLFIEFEKPFWSSGWKGFNLLWEKEDLSQIRNSPNIWLEDVFGFYTDEYQPNVLCGWIFGANAKRMEMSSEKNVLDNVIILLRKFLTWAVPEPIGFKRSTWYTNPNYRGSYSFRSLRTDQLGTEAADLAEPILQPSDGSPILQFAGEATHDHYYSTVHGAVESGWREAHRLAAFYSKIRSHL